MTMLTKRLAAVAAGVFGPKRAGDRLAGSKRGRLGLNAKGVVALTRGFLFTVGPAIGLMALVAGTAPVATTRPIGRPGAKREGAPLSP